MNDERNSVVCHDLPFDWQPGNERGDGAGTQNELITAALRHVSDSVMLTNANSRAPGPQIVYVNPAFTRMTGYAENEVIGRTPDVLYGTATSRRFLDQLRECVVTGRSFCGKAIHYRKDGSRFLADWRLDPIRDVAGKVTHWVAVQRDVTGQETPDRFFHEQIRELPRVAILAALAQIAQDTIHDSLQPLYAIGNLGAACRNAIRNKGLESESERILGWLDSIIDAVQQSKSSLSRLRSYARHAESHRETLSMNDVIEPAFAALSLDYADTRVSFDVQLECSSFVEADGAQIRFVLANLVQNAVDSIQRASAKTGNIKLRSWSQDGSCYVSVDDDGPGFQGERLDDIFRPFYTTTTKGLGLGLTFCRAIVTTLGGDIFAETGENGGLHIEFVIPEKQVLIHD